MGRRRVVEGEPTHAIVEVVTRESGLSSSGPYMLTNADRRFQDVLAGPSETGRAALDLRRRTLRTGTRGAFSRILREAFPPLLHHLRSGRGAEPFLDPTPSSAIESVPYTTLDGWRNLLFRLPPPNGARGEPILLASALGLNHHALEGRTPGCLLESLHARGFDLYLFEHRGHRSAWPPERPTPWNVETLANQDLQAAIETVRARSGFDRIGYVGFGLGGQLLYVALATDPNLPVFAAATVGAPVRFPRAPRSAAAALGMALALSGTWNLPFHALAKGFSPLVDPRSEPARALRLDVIQGPRLRALCWRATEDPSLGMLAQLCRWYQEGRLVDPQGRVDYVEALTDIDLPLLVLVGEDDPMCSPESARPPLEHIGGQRSLLRLVPGARSHVDLVCGGLGNEVLGDMLCGWFEDRV